jgi:hypothetical protein
MRYTIFFLLILFKIIVYSQNGTWTWMKGDSTSGAFGHFGVMGIASPMNNPPALYEACEWTDLQGNFWVYGGININNTQGQPFYSALWKYTVATNMWTWIKGDTITNNNPPVYGTKGVPALSNDPCFRGYGTLSWTDNQGDLWLFGGRSGVLDSRADLWRYNITTNMWTWMSGSNVGNAPGIYGTKGVASTTNYPAARFETSSSWTDINNNLWMFGGKKNTGLFNDLWKYNVTTNMWTWMKGDSTVNSLGVYGTKGLASILNNPPARCNYSRWKDKLGNLWLMGGLGAGLYNDLWKYEISTNMWTWVNGPNLINDLGLYGYQCDQFGMNNPPSRFENRACWTDNSGGFWMFGGFTYNSSSFNDLWYYNPTNNKWRWFNGNDTLNDAGLFGTLGVSNSASIPSARGGSLSFKDSQGNLWLYGGFNESSMMLYSDLWKFIPDTNCFTSTAINMLEQNISYINIFPNPNNGIFEIKINDKKIKEAVISVFDFLGNKIYYSNITSQPMIRKIDLSSQPSGIYTVSILCKGKYFKQKIIIDK